MAAQRRAAFPSYERRPFRQSAAAWRTLNGFRIFVPISAEKPHARRAAHSFPYHPLESTSTFFYAAFRIDLI